MKSEKGGGRNAIRQYVGRLHVWVGYADTSPSERSAKRDNSRLVMRLKRVALTLIPPACSCLAISVDIGKQIISFFELFHDLNVNNY